MFETFRPRSRTPLRAVTAGVATVALAASGLLLVSAPAAAASGTVTGTVFRDFGSDGELSTTPLVDEPLAGVTVTAYDSAGNAVGTTQSAADGTYTLDVVDAATDDVRIQFTGVPAGYAPAYHGAGNGTSVQFTTIGATGVDYAVNAPDDYSQGAASTPLALPIRWTGLRSGFTTADRPSLVSVPWNATLNGNGEYDQRTTLATYTQTGSLWGTAYQRTSGDLFSSATLQRHSDLGPLGLGGIYRVPGVLNPDGTLGTPGAVEEWLDVQGLPVAGGGTIDLGESTIDWAARGLNGPTNPAHDTQAYDAIGTIGIGDIEVSSDGSMLYFVNLFDKNLYSIDIANPTEATRIPLNLAAGERPWAIEVHHGQVYIGYVESGEGGGNAAVTTQQAIVRATSETDLAPLGTAGSQIFATALNYVKGSPGSDAQTSVPNGERFLAWHTWASSADYDRALYSFGNLSDPAPMMDWAQPMLTDLTFTSDGNLVLGLADRSGWQLGNDNYGPLDGQTDLTQGVSSGDTLVAGVQADGSFVLENDGVVGDHTTAGTLPNQGPGGREFIDDAFINASNGARQHNEITLGGLAAVAGFEDIVTSAIDPTEGASRTGIRWSSTNDGSNSNGYQVTQAGHEGSFEKSGGLGDLQALVNAAPVEIGNRVWFDADRDGVQDAGEPAVPGVTVTLLDADGQPVAGVDPVVTGATGEYYFSGIDPDLTYTVSFDASAADVSGLAEFGVTDPAQLSWTTLGDDTAAATREIDSNVDPAAGTAVVAVGGPGQNDHTIDAGLIAAVLCTVGDFVWVDANENGIQDDGEAPVEGATVELLNAAGEVVGTDTTDAEGGYLFEDVECATYRVRFTIPEGNTFTTTGAGDDTAVDSNPTPSEENPLIGLTPEFTVTPQTPEDLTIDAGIVPADVLCTVGDVVWVDVDADGIQDAGEAGVADVTVELLNAEGEVVETATTAADGSYLFEGVECATYRVRFTIPEGNTFTTPDAGDDTAVDSNPTPSEENPLIGVTPEFTVTPENPEDLTIDAGVITEEPLCTVGDFVWVDANENGIQDQGEAPVEGATVELLNAEGEVVGTATTDAEGGYLFEGVECATYRVRFTIPEGNTFTTPDAGDDTAVDSNPTPSEENPLIGLTPEFTVTPENPEDLTIDAGIVPADVLCTVGDFVWVDANENGIQDQGEAPVEGATVELLNAEGEVVGTATTDAEGGYLFEGVECATYRVRFTIPEGNTFTAPDAGDDTAVDSNPTPSEENPLIGVTPEFTVTPENPEDLTIDAGIVPADVLCTVGDFVWVDADKDGIQDAGEAGVADVTVELLNAEGEVVETATTDAAGAYLFEGVECATYRVRFTIPEGNTFTTPDAGDDTAVDSNPTPSEENPLIGVTPEFTVTPENPEDLTIDAGVITEEPLCTIGDVVWVDTDRDGIQDEGEAGVAGATVELLNADGVVVATTTTAADGSYLFQGVECATYRVRFTVPTGYEFTTPDAGDDTAVDSNPTPSEENPLIGVTPEFEVTPENPEDLTIDAGVVTVLCTVGDFVWVDADKDGVQDAGEAGVAGVSVELINGAGEIVATTTTAADGSYLFEGIECGTYRAYFTLPVGYEFTTPVVGDDTAVDSNPTPTAENPLNGITEEFTVTPENPEDLTIDAGVITEQPLCSIGDVVWVDLDKDGIQDAGEKGLGGVTVELLNAAGDVVVVVKTDANGSYLFEGVACGEYRVRFTIPTGYVFTTPGSGDDTAVDSNPTATDKPTIGVTPFFTVTPENPKDLTIDAGVFPTPPPLATTGGEIMIGAIAAGLMLLLAGGVLAAVRRRRTA